MSDVSAASIRARARSLHPDRYGFLGPPGRRSRNSVLRSVLAPMAIQRRPAQPPAVTTPRRRPGRELDMELSRNLARRKLRTALTITGITVGIWALVVFGALATKIDTIVSGAHDYFGNRVIVSSASGGGGMFPLSRSLVAKARGLDGVDIAYGEINTMVDHEAKQVGLPDEIVGMVAGADEGRDALPVSIRSRAARSPRRTRAPGSRCWAPILLASMRRRSVRRFDSATRLHRRRDPRADADPARHPGLHAARGSAGALRQGSAG